MRVIFAGSGEFGLPTLTSLVDGGTHEVVTVVTQPERPAGRGRRLTPTPVGGFALARGLPLVRTPDINAEPLPAADVMVVIAFGQKIAPHVVDAPRLGSVNLHSSRLPKYRGAAPINWAVINGDATTGNSVIRLAERMDAGAVLGQTELAIGEIETAGELHDRLARDGVALVDRVLARLAASSAVEVPQDHALATAAPKLSRERATIDWVRPARVIADQIRGMYPWPGCRVRLMSDATEVARLTLALARSRPDGGDAGISPGTITPDGTIVTADGRVEVIELVPEGKRIMPLAAFRNGHPWERDMRLESVA